MSSIDATCKWFYSKSLYEPVLTILSKYLNDYHDCITIKSKIDAGLIFSITLKIYLDILKFSNFIFLGISYKVFYTELFEKKTSVTYH